MSNVAYHCPCPSSLRRRARACHWNGVIRRPTGTKLGLAHTNSATYNLRRIARNGSEGAMAVAKTRKSNNKNSGKSAASGKSGGAAKSGAAAKPALEAKRKE